MTRIGYKLMSEEHGPSQLVTNAIRAEELGFDFLGISDHYSPWITEQGHSPFAWSVLGAIAHATKRVGLMTGVTCPFRRYHPPLVGAGLERALGAAAAEELRGSERVGRAQAPRRDAARSRSRDLLRAIDEFVDAGFDHILLTQAGPDQDGFFEFFERELRPELESRMQPEPAGARSR